MSVTTFFVYLLVRYEHDVQDAINILWTAYSCLGISTVFSLPDLIIILLFQVISFKESFFIKVQINCQSLTNWVGLLCFWHWKARFVLLLCCKRNSTGQWPEEEVLSCPAFVSSLSEGQKPNTNEILSKTDKTWTWCCIIVSSHICWINFVFSRKQQMFYKLYSEKRKEKKIRIYLPTYPYLNLWVGFGQTEIF